ncbi:MAG: hypothetical protein ACREDM_04205 [Methylocella sp.]
MSPLRLHLPPPRPSWWQRYWDSFKANFPGRSGEQARAFALTVIMFATLMFLTRLYFEYRGTRI